MNNKRRWRTLFLFAVVLVLSINANAASIRGEVLNDDGEPESGVWVIAETDELGTAFRKIVVTNDDGRFVIPELPSANYEVWVRGYGLSDSDKVSARSGGELTLAAARADDAFDAAQVYPSHYWLALLQPPPASSFPSPDGTYATQAAWRSQLKLNCVLCHQLGSLATRLANGEAFDTGLKKSSGMNYFANALGRTQLLLTLDDWARRIENGATPPPPPRPAGIERNFVITQWAWGDSYTYAHDEIATDKRNPHLNANGPIYGVDLGNDYLLTVDPVAHTAQRVPVPTNNGFDTPWCEQTYKALNDSNVMHFGFGSLGCPDADGETAHANRYQNPANPHNPMMDAQGRVWLTSQIRRQWAEDLPPFCQRSAVIADNLHHRQLIYFEPETGHYTPVDTCFGTHHLQFDNNDVLWLSGDNFVIGWLDTKLFSADDPASLERAQSWSEVRVDSTGDGAADTPIVGFHYGIIPNPTDGSVWTAIPPGISSPAGGRGLIQRFDPASGRHEVFRPPEPGYGPRGIDVDSEGVIWTALAGSGHLARFDRRRCTQTWGLGDQCPEGWTLWESPGPQFSGVAEQDNGGSTDMHYYLWVDQFNTLGMGQDTVVVNGTGSDALLAFDRTEEAFVTIRIPYPLNTYTRGLDGRIDDPETGWRGRALWFTNGLDPIIHAEIPQSFVGKVQLRPHPLAE